jgi:hypothetical protein
MKVVASLNRHWRIKRIHAQSKRMTQNLSKRWFHLQNYCWLRLRIFVKYYCRTVECWEIESIFSQLKVWNEIRWESVEKFIWLRTGSSGGPLYTQQKLMNFGFYKIQGISRLALQLAASEDGLSSIELVADEFTCSIKVYLTRMKLTWLHL